MGRCDQEVKVGMKVIEISQFGAPEVLVVGERPVPTPGVGEALVRVRASGVNRPDVLQRSGLYPAPAGASDLPGLEISGVIEAGDPVALAQAGFKVGDRVCALVAGGGYAQWCVAPMAQCLPIPEGITDAEAAGLPETFFTVWSNVFDRGHLKAGETLFIHGGTSGIGVTAIQLAKAFGAQVIVTCGSDEKSQACLDLGADHAINYKTTDFSARVLELTAGRGADVILDMVAGDYIAKNVVCLAEDGRLVVIAVQGGVNAQFDAAQLMRKRLTITGSTLRPRPIAFKQAIAQSLREHVWPMLQSGRIKPVLFQAIDAIGEPGQSGACTAHALMESNRHFGKIVLTWS